MTTIYSDTQRANTFLSDEDYWSIDTTHSSVSQYPVLAERVSPTTIARPGESRPIKVLCAGKDPSWLEPTMQALAELLSLEADWDSYGARRIDRENVLSMLDLLARVMADDSPVPSVVPTSNGGVQVEWHMRGIDFEIETVGPRRFEASFEDAATGEEWDGPVSAETPRLSDYIARLS